MDELAAAILIAGTMIRFSPWSAAIVICASAVIPGRAQQPNPDSTPENIQTLRIRPDTYFLQGRSNAAFVVGDDGVILIDTMTAGHAEVIRQRIAEVARKPIKYVVNTHFHPDHTGSNDVFGSVGIAIVAQENTLRRLSAPSTNMRGEVIPAAAITARPTLTYTDRKTLALPGLEAKLLYAPAGHTDGDTYVWLKKQNVIVAGDLLHTHEYPFFDVKDGGSFAGNVRALEAMLKIANQDTVILPGHGGPFTKSQLDAYLQMIYRIRDVVKESVEQGKSEAEVLAKQPLLQDRSVLPGGPDNRDNFVRLVYQAYATVPQ